MTRRSNHGGVQRRQWRIKHQLFQLVVASIGDDDWLAIEEFGVGDTSGAFSVAVSVDMHSGFSGQVIKEKITGVQSGHQVVRVVGSKRDGHHFCSHVGGGNHDFLAQDGSLPQVVEKNTPSRGPHGYDVESWCMLDAGDVLAKEVVLGLENSLGRSDVEQEETAGRGHNDLVEVSGRVYQPDDFAVELWVDRLEGGVVLGGEKATGWFLDDVDITIG